MYHLNEETIRLDVRLADDTVWLNQSRIGELFGVDRTVINRHIHNIYKTGELEETATCANLAQVQVEGGRTKTRHIPFYNLDVIIAVGYRVNSFAATQFRRCANNILKDYLLRGYAALLLPSPKWVRKFCPALSGQSARLHQRDTNTASRRGNLVIFGQGFRIDTFLNDAG